MRAGVAAAAGCVVMGAGACATPAGGHPPSAVPTAPAVSLLTLGGEPADLASVVRGRAAVVTFWATWCEACQRELPMLERLSAAAGGDAVVVGVDVGETPSTVDGFARAHALRYLVLVDPDFRLSDALGLPMVPATLVLDRDARIVYRGRELDERALAAFREAIASARASPEGAVDAARPAP